MHIKKFFFCISFLIVYSSSAHSRLLLIDTALDAPYNYQTLMTLCKDTGFVPEHSHFYDLPRRSQNNYDAVFLAISNEFIAHLDHPFVKETLAWVKKFSERNNVLVGILLPKQTSVSDNFVKACSNVLNTFSLSDAPNKNRVEKFVAQGLTILLQPAVQRSYWYNTTLLARCIKSETPKPEAPNYACILSNNGTPLATYLPVTHSINNQVFEKIFPHGFVIVNPQTHTTYFITTQSLLTPGELEENFWLNPTNTQLRQQFKHNTRATLHDVYTIAQNSTIKSLSGAHNLPALSPKKTYMVCNNKKPIIAAWMDLEPLTKDSATLQAGIEAIKDAQLTFLWITLTPEQYFSPIGTNKHKKQEFFNSVRQCTQQLKKTYGKEPLPVIAINFNITFNYEKSPVHAAAVDIFGHTYSKIPSPLEFNEFWRQEVLDSFDQLVKIWDTDIGSGIPIGAIFFDCEMYHAQTQAASFTNLMDFSDNSWNLYIQQKNKPELKKLSVPERINFLKKQFLFKEYFEVLKHEAHSIGERIKNHVRAAKPDIIIGAYAMTLPSTWFLQGFLAGLSSKEKPIILATFNNDFECHRTWLEEQHIYCKHLAAMLLSQFTHLKDFLIIDQLLGHHDGIWINKFSRLMQSRNPKDWEWGWGPESSPLPTDIVTRALNNHITDYCSDCATS